MLTKRPKSLRGDRFQLDSRNTIKLSISAKAASSPDEAFSPECLDEDQSKVEEEEEEEGGEEDEEEEEEKEEEKLKACRRDFLDEP